MSMPGATDICDRCREFFAIESTHLATSNDGRLAKDFEIHHHNDVEELLECMTGCSLCLQMFAAMFSSHIPALDPLDGKPSNLMIKRHESQTVQYKELLEQGISLVEIQRGEGPGNGISMAYIKDLSCGVWQADGAIPFSSRLPVIRHWLDDCLQNHPNCESYGRESSRGDAKPVTEDSIQNVHLNRMISRFSMLKEMQIPGSKFCPTRLIDVGIQGSSSSVKLVVISENGGLESHDLTYIALSHCWGPQPTGIPILTTTSLDKFKKQIELESLPKNFQDAIQGTRTLGVRYIWIDSLCIQQDLGEDWEYEASVMDQVYKNSLVTLSVTDSANAHGGFFLDTVPPAIDVNLNPAEPKLRVRLPAAEEQELHFSPLQARGWVLQELVLSRRTIHFTRQQMFWQCRCQFSSEDGIINDRRFRSLSYGWMPLVRELMWEEPASTYEHWWLWVHDFSHRTFTFSKDKLAAIAGITQFYVDWTKETPMLGMWLEHLTKELSWYLETPRRAPIDAQPTVSEIRELPSWSWLAHDTASVAGPFGRLNSPSHRAHMIVVDIMLEWERRPYTSKLKKRPWMMVHASMTQATFFPWPKEHDSLRPSPLSGHNHPRRWLMQGQTPCEYTQCFLDFDIPTAGDGFEAYCLLIGWNKFPVFDELYNELFRGFGTFLIVTMVQRGSQEHTDGLDVYARIGVGRFPGEQSDATPFGELERDYYLLT